MARLLANGEQYFADNNGNPLGLGKVYFYIPTTTDFKDTWQDADESIFNDNPVVLDAAGRAIIYGRGEYRQVVTDADDNEIWDQLTSTFDSQGSGVLWGDVSTGTPNFQTITIAAGSPDSLVGQIICFLAGFTNTAAAQLGVDTFDPLFMVKDTDAGPAQLTGGEIVAGNLVCCMFDEDAQVYHLIEYAPNDLVLKTLKVNRLSFGLSVTTAALTGDTNDWDPTGLSTTSRIRTSSSAAVRLTGIVAQLPNRFLLFDNVGGFSITLGAEDTGSAVGNRFQIKNDIIVGANSSVLLVYDNTGAGWHVYALTVESVLPIMSLTVETSSADTAQLTAARAPVVNADNLGLTLFAVDVIGDITTNGADGLDTGTVAANTGYYIWLIYNPATLVAAMLFSLSSTAPTLPSGFTYKARYGWIPTDGSADLMSVIQRGAVARYVLTGGQDIPLITSGAAATPTTSVPVTTVGFLPATAPIITVGIQTNQNNYTFVGSNALYQATTGKYPPMASFFSATPADIVLETTDLYYSCGAEGGELLCYGWTDDIG